MVLVSAATIAPAFGAHEVPGGNHYNPAAQGKVTAVAPGLGDTFAQSVGISADTLVAGAHNNDNLNGFDAGAAYVFTRVNSLWVQQAILTASDGSGSDLFGTVSIDGDVIAVGARWHDALGTNSGAVYVFRRAGLLWNEEAKLTANDGAAFDLFGNWLTIDGDVIVVGAFGDDNGGGQDAGAAYVFRRVGSTWLQEAKLVAADGAAGDNFGEGAAVSGDTIVIGANLDDSGVGTNAGAAYVFSRQGGPWTQTAKLVPSDSAAGDNFGNSASISGDTLIIGASADDTTGGSDAGSAYVFRLVNSAWTQEAKLTALDGAASDFFGRQVDLDGDVALVGALGDDDQATGTDAGSAYVFVRTGSSWSLLQKLTAFDAASFDYFGNFVGIDGNTIIVSAHRDDLVSVPDAGSAYLYEGGVLPPDADITPVPPAECVQGRATVSLDGSSSHGHQGLPLSFLWTAPGITFDDPASPTPSASFPFGKTTVTLTVTEGALSDSESAEVVVVDTMLPSVAVARPARGAAYLTDIEARHGVNAAGILAVGALTLEAAALDQCGVSGVLFLAPGGFYSIDATVPYQAEFNRAAQFSGQVTVSMTAIDRGSHTASASVAFLHVGTDS